MIAELISSHDAKTCPIEDVEDVFDLIRFRTEPMAHQARSLLWALERERVAFWLDVGTGKTLLALYTLKLWGCKRILVVSPNPVVETWANEIKRHTGWDYVILKGTVGERRRKLKQKHRLYIINYEGLQVLFGKVVEKKYEGKVHRHHVIDAEAIRKVQFDAIIADEVHRVKSPKALVTKISRELSRQVKHCIVMTGTPLTRDQRDLWAEMSVMDLGQALGNNYWAFVRKYFRPYGFDWILKTGSLEQMLERVAENTIRFSREECFDLPDKMYETLHIPMSKMQMDLTAGLIESAQIEAEEGWNTAAVLNVGNKLAQVAGGFLIMAEGKPIKRLPRNPKLDALGGLVEEIAGKFIMYHHFREEGAMIEELLRKMGVSYRAVRGGVKDQARQLSEFKEDLNVQALVAHPACGGEGINLQEAATEIFYSNGFNFVHRVQAEGRIHRLGQTERCLYLDLVMVDEDGDSIDVRILKALAKKADVAQEVLDYIKGGGV